MRGLTIKEREILQAQGCSASCWDQVLVSDDFRTEQLQRVRLIGDVRIGSNSHITHSTIANYHIGNDCYIDSVLRIECRHSSTFGNGVMVAAVNENEGRSTPIYVELTAQTAYIMAMMRNRLDAVNNLKASAMRYAEAHRNEVGTIGNNVTIIGDRSGGGGGIPCNFDLPNGWYVRLSTTPMLDINGVHTEFGIDPTEGFKIDMAPDAHITGKDAILDKAIEFLSTK